MTDEADRANRVLERYRAYLETLTAIQLDPRLRSKFGLSDLIQNTLLEAYQSIERIEAMDSDAQKRWLRKMFLNNLLEEIDRFRRACRDYRVERSLEGAADQSSCRLKEWVAAEDSTPGERFVRQERALRLLEAMSQLDARQREALILQKYHGWKLSEIAEHMECTTGVVAGLHARGLARLRELLPDLE
jgi:RNA polymerase sigma-70 factor (ECF subfamily)